MQEIAKEEFVQWKNNVVTEFIFKEIREEIEDYTNALRGYVRAGESVSAARCEGCMEGLERLLHIDYEDPKEDNEND